MPSEDINKEALVDDYGLSGWGLAGAGMAFGKLLRVPVYVWILSSPSPRPVGTRGKWVDDENWTDDNIWYD